MRRILLALFGGLLAASLVLQPGLSRTPENAGPQFTADGKLLRPEGYRRWVFVSSGFGMSYNANAGGNGAPAFTNVLKYSAWRHHGPTAAISNSWKRES